MPIITCICGQKNRLKPATHQKCGKCGHEFNAREVMQASLGDRPELTLNPKHPGPRSTDDFDLEQESECEFCGGEVCEECLECCSDCDKCSCDL